MNPAEEENNAFPLASGTGAHTLRAPVAWKRKITGGILGVIGFILSPLSWWNDAVVNLPLALIFAYVVGIFYKPASERGSTSFDAMVILGYWLTNILGFVLLHKGARQVLSNQDSKYSRRQLAKDVGISLVYTCLIVFLIKLGILQPIQDYFAKK
jgi:Ca2+/Na+ antiporter